MVNGKGTAPHMTEFSQRQLATRGNVKIIPPLKGQLKMGDKPIYEICFMFNTYLLFSIIVSVGMRGIWRWHIKRPLTLERLDI